MVSVPRILFIGGVGRSGSTILDLMLGQVPGYVSVGELSYVWGRSDDDLCGCGCRFGDCAFWNAVGEHAFGGWAEVDRARLAILRSRVDRHRRLLTLLRRRRTRSAEEVEYGTAMLALYRGIERASGARTVVDSTKHPSTAALLRSLGVDLRIVHMVRDPRGVAYSWTKRQPRPGIAGGAMMDRYPPWRSAVRWVGFNAAFHLLGAMRVPSERVRYEDLVEQPVSILEKATAIAGEARTAFPFIRGTTVSMAEAHTIAGNPMRFDRGALELRRDDAWRSRLSAANRRVVVAIAFPMMVAYGYIGRQASSPR